MFAITSLNSADTLSPKYNFSNFNTNEFFWGGGSGGGSVGRAVASDTRDTQFESEQWQNLSTNCTLK